MQRIAILIISCTTTKLCGGCKPYAGALGPTVCYYGRCSVYGSVEPSTPFRVPCLELAYFVGQ